MTKMTGLERLHKVMNNEEPDQIPHGELHAQNVRDAILPGASYADFVDHLDLDFICGYDKLVSWQWEMEDDAKLIVRDQWAGLAQLTSDQPHPMDPAIKTEKDLDGYPPPIPTTRGAWPGCRSGSTDSKATAPSWPTPPTFLTWPGRAFWEMCPTSPPCSSTQTLSTASTTSFWSTP